MLSSAYVMYAPAGDLELHYRNATTEAAWRHAAPASNIRAATAPRWFKLPTSLHGRVTASSFPTINQARERTHLLHRILISPLTKHPTNGAQISLPISSSSRRRARLPKRHPQPAALSPYNLSLRKSRFGHATKLPGVQHQATCAQAARALNFRPHCVPADLNRKLLWSCARPAGCAVREGYNGDCSGANALG